MSDWINIEHHLPSKRGNYLCVMMTKEANRKFYFQEICHYNGNGEWTEENRLQKVVYWMPLPKLPEEVANEKL